MEFKQVLEYFVAHLEYVAGGNQAGSRGYDMYIAHLVAAGNFKISGQGYSDDQIQNQLPEFSYRDNRLCITVQSGYQFKSAATYLNWLGAWTKIVAEWDGNSINALKIYYPVGFKWKKNNGIWEKKPEWKYETKSLESLGLFVGSDSENETLNDFLYKFYEKYAEEKKNMANIKLKDMCTLLEEKKNIILQGAPGTGKTYSTASVAVKMIKEDFPNFDNHTEIMKEYDALKIKVNPDARDKKFPSSQGEITEGQIAFVTFHQSMDYEDFIEGIKPVSGDGKISYVIENGIFKMMARKAAENSNEKYILVIDEINRGNISKILGELITLLEPDKRMGNAHPVTVTLPYSKEGFIVPSNLYIIGTMNTTDRSAGNIDYAIRRRFAFITLEADRGVIQSESTEEALKLFDAVKKFIEENKTSEIDMADLQIGHSYFLLCEQAKKNDEIGCEQLQRRWEYEIFPLLREYYKDGLLKKDISPDDFKSFQSFINPPKEKKQKGKGAGEEIPEEANADESSSENHDRD